jgi:hypothetical protein
MVNGENKGMFILDVEPKELTIVLILGPINVDQLSRLHGIGGLHALADVQRNVRGKDKENDKEKTKEKDKDKKDGDQ